MTTRTQASDITASSLTQPEPIVRDEDKQSHAESLTDTDLCAYIEKAFEQSKSATSYNLPYLAEARKRFAKPGRRVPVSGQPSWSEWVDKHLCITDRHVRRLLAEYRQKQLEASDPDKAQRLRLEAEQKKTEAEQKRAKAREQKEAEQKLTVALAAKAIELAERVTNGDLDAAQNLASAILDSAKNADSAVLMTAAPIPCGGCEQLHSGIAAVLAAAEPQKSLDAVARDCGVSTTVVRQAATRFGIYPVLAAEEVTYVA